MRQLKGAAMASTSTSCGDGGARSTVARPRQLKGGWRPVTPLSSTIYFLSVSAPSTLSPLATGGLKFKSRSTMVDWPRGLETYTGMVDIYRSGPTADDGKHGDGAERAAVGAQSRSSTRRRASCQNYLHRPAQPAG